MKSTNLVNYPLWSSDEMLPEWLVVRDVIGKVVGMSSENSSQSYTDSRGSGCKLLIKLASM